MKPITFLFFLLFSNIISAQLNDDFSTSKIVFNSNWAGDTNAFELDNECLKLNAPTTESQVIIYRKFTDTSNLVFEISCSLDFSPSTSNQLEIYLVDNEQLQNGYLLQLGENGTNDAISCYQVTNGIATFITKGIAQRVASSFDSLKISFTLNDSLQLKSSLPNELEIEEFKVFRKTTLSLNCIAINCNYTSTRATKFSFDDLKITPLKADQNNTLIQIPPAYHAQFHDLLFTELMIDPTPKRFLPEAEFIELYNNTDSTIQLKNWSISNETSTAILDSFSLTPQQTILLCDEDDFNKFSQYKNVLPVNSLVTLSNTAFTLNLFSPTNDLIHQISYDSDHLYSNKKSGGYTYSLVDQTQPCLATSWSFSENELGGTIDQVSFEARDQSIPQIHNYNIINDSILIKLNSRNKDDTYYSKEILFPSSNESLFIHLKTCNHLSNDTVIQLTSNYATGHLIFNEVLTNSPDDCPEFIELYNNSADFIKVNDLYLGYSSTSEIPDDIAAFPNGLIIPPHTYVVLSSDINQLKQFYEISSNCVMVDIDLPTLLNDEGHLFLIDAFGGISSSFSYNKELHNDLLDDEKGISLERINFDSEQWVSGNSSKGGASVGQINDGFSLDNQEKIKITVNENHYSLTQNQPIIFDIKLNDGNYFGDLIIFSKEGRKIKELYTNIQFSTNDHIELDDFSFINELGIYVIYFEFRHPETGIQRKRIPLVIIE